MTTKFLNSMSLNDTFLNSMLSNARFAGVFIMLLLLSGCARNPVLLQSTYQALPPHAEITSVPF